MKKDGEEKDLERCCRLMYVRKLGLPPTKVRLSRPGMATLTRKYPSKGKIVRIEPADQNPSSPLALPTHQRGVLSGLKV
jgi:hypothetical protein